MWSRRRRRWRRARRPSRPVPMPRSPGLAQRYLAGEDLDPEALVPPEGRHRIPLPGYPFRRVPCGLRAATRPRTLRGLHPLLDRVLPNGAFHTAIDPTEPLLADHLVQGEPILPGACVIGMALAAARAATGRAATGLSAVSFRAPVGEAEAAGLLLRLEEGRFTLCAEAGQGGPLATGTLGWEAPAAAAALDLAAIRARLPVLLEGDALAARFAGAGVALGPLFPRPAPDLAGGGPPAGGGSGGAFPARRGIGRDRRL